MLYAIDSSLTHHVQSISKNYPEYHLLSAPHHPCPGPSHGRFLPALLQQLLAGLCVPALAPLQSVLKTAAKAAPCNDSQSSHDLSAWKDPKASHSIQSKSTTLGWSPEPVRGPALLPRSCLSSLRLLHPTPPPGPVTSHTLGSSPSGPCTCWTVSVLTAHSLASPKPLLRHRRRSEA